MDINLDDLWKNTVKKLRNFARQNKINLRGKYLKADIIEIIREYLEGLENVVTDEPESALETLPPELLKEVVLRLSVSEMVTVCSANKVISNLCEPLWKDKYRELYGKQAPVLDPELSWKCNLLRALRLGVYGFGRNDRGQLGLGDKIDKNSPQRIPDKSFRLYDETIRIIQISAGNDHTACLDEDGVVWTFGSNNNEKLGSFQGMDTDTPSIVGLLFFRIDKKEVKTIQVSAGGDHTVFLDENGNVWGVGSNWHGQLGLGEIIDPEETNRPIRIDPSHFLVDQRPVKITKVSAGSNYTVCLDENGNVWTFGKNNEGQLGLGTEAGRIVDTPKQISPLQFDGVRIVQVSAGRSHTVCLDDDGDVWTFGWNIDGQLGLGDISNKFTPQRIHTLSGITQVSAGSRYTVCLDNEMNVWSFGWNDIGQLGLGTDQRKYSTPQRIPDLSRIIQVSAGDAHTMCLDKNGNVWGFGGNTYGQLGLGTDQRRYFTPQKIENIKAIQVSAGNNYTMLIGS